MHKKICCLLSLWALCFFLISPPDIYSSDLPPGTAPETVGKDLSPTVQQEQLILLKVPLFSPHFANTPVALVNDVPITLGELSASLKQLDENKKNQEGERTSDYQVVLQNLINARLIDLKAKNTGLNETGAVKSFLVNSPGSHSSDQPQGTPSKAGGKDTSTALQKEQFISLKVPLYSAHFAKTPVALVNDEPITLDELARGLGQMTETETKQQGENAAVYEDALQRLVNTRLIIQEAKNIGLGETSAIQNEIEDFKLTTLRQDLIYKHLEGLEPDPADVENVYQQISREVQLYAITFESGPEAQKFLDEVKDSGFDQLAERYIEEGKAKGKRDEQYVKIKDLRSQIAQKVYSMNIGDVSNVFRTDDGFLLFQLTDSRFVEDEAVKQEAYKIVYDSFRKQKAMEYGNILTEKYVIFDETLYEEIDFNKNFEQLKNDTRILATVKGDEPVTITVADLAKNVDVSFFHGADKAQQLQMLNKKKDIAITNMLFKITAEREARFLGLDKTEEYVTKVQEFENSVLFREFMNKVILPDVKLTPEEVRSYYDAHIDEYSSPAMLRMNSLVFQNQEDAEIALGKLQKGADFKWVSANVSGFVPPDTKGVLPFDEKLLSLTSLPDDLQKTAGVAKKGDSLLYEAPEGNFYYVLLIEDVYPPEPEPFEKARNAAAKALFEMKRKQIVDDWLSKLAEFYAPQIFLTGMDR
ncbi:MAG: hypothetical protein AMJ61_03175 [Desulfobacterales bacterium SG8_35_2]|nr:MAG: hypothetical protein AMJ61_03175 [Desulfobacterales bacterium SG8_35_2]